MPHSKPRRETRVIQVIDPENDPVEEIFSISDLDCIMPKIYVPLTSTYKLADGADKELIVSNICAGLAATMREYRFLAGNLVADAKGTYFVKRSAAQAQFTVHVSHLEHTDSPSYAELEARDFPISELGEQMLAPSFAGSPVERAPGEGVPVTLVQVNLLRGGVVIGTAIHHINVDARGLDAIMARWAANTRALFTGTPAPPFDPACLDTAPLNSPTPVPADQMAEVEQRIMSLKYAPGTPQKEADAADMVGRIWHFSTSALAALKAATVAGIREPGKWVSTNDCVTALMWRCALRARLPLHGVAQSSGKRVRLMQSLDVRAHVRPAMPAAYPGNVVAFSCVEREVAALMAADALPAMAVAVRGAVDRWRAQRMTRDMKDYVAACADRSGVQFNFDVVKGLDVLVTSWRVLTAYQTHDFGFGELKALRWASVVFDGYTFFYPRRPKDDPEEGIEVFISLEKSVMDRLLEDEELAKWAQVRG